MNKRIPFTFRQWASLLASAVTLFFLIWAICYLIPLLNFSSAEIFFTPYRSSLETKENVDAIGSVLSVLGLINFTLPFIVTARNTRMYGISLAQVMYSRFWWHGLTYIFYALLIISGIMLARLGYVAFTLPCLIGVFVSFISIGIVTFIFVFHQKSAVPYIEQYLTQPSFREDWYNRQYKKRAGCNESEELKKLQNERILRIGEYIHKYYSATKTVPQSVVNGLLDVIKDIPLSKDEKPALFDDPDKKEKEDEIHFFFYNSSSLSRNSIETVYRIRCVCEIIFNEFDFSKRATLLKDLIVSLSRNSRYIQYIQKESTGKKKDIREVNLMLCGMAAYLRTTIASRNDIDKWYESWKTLIELFNTAEDISFLESRAGNCADNNGFDLFKKLIMLIQATVLVDKTAIIKRSDYRPSDDNKEKLADKYEKLNDLFSRFNEKFAIEESNVLGYYSLGQAAVLAANDIDYDPQQYVMHSYWLLRWLNSSCHTK